MKLIESEYKKVLKVKQNRPVYDPFMTCYKVEWKNEDGWNTRYFDNYSLGIEFLKTSFPSWFSKHF